MRRGQMGCFGNSIASPSPVKTEKKVEAHLKEPRAKQRTFILTKTPRTSSGNQTQDGIGLFLNYDTGKGLNNQEITTER